MKLVRKLLLNPGEVYRLIREVFATNKLSEHEKDFVVHNKRVWKAFRKENDGGEILIESIDMSSSIIAFSYLGNLLAKLHRASIVAYSGARKNLVTRLMNGRVNRIYRSFNVSNFLYHALTTDQIEDGDRLFQEIYPSLRTTRDVEGLKLEGVWVGDLVYDSHCLNYKVPTVSISDERFRKSLREAVDSYVFWRDYFRKHKVKSVILSHTVYVTSGVVTRLAVEAGIPVYQINATHLHYLTKRDLWAYDEFLYYPEEFLELSEEERRKGLQLAKERLEKRFSGEVGVDMHYSKKSAYGEARRDRVLNKSNKIKILVATHCFFDAPHPYGINLFPDFYEWLYFLGEISKLTDYEWYIKTHPDFLPGNIPIIEEFISKHPKFKMIPSDTSHLQLVEEGINFGLTVYGTIGFEYAALGIPVINASLCNPRIRYSFNKHPRSIGEYKDILLNLPGQTVDIDINEVYEYYFMAFIYNVNDWLFEDYDGFIRDIGGYYQQYGPISYKKFVDNFSLKRHKQILGSLDRFVVSGEYNFRQKFLKEEER